MLPKLTLLLSVALVPLPFVNAQVHFAAPLNVSDESGGNSPGELAAKVKLVRLVNTPMRMNDGRLVIAYGDAAHNEDVWEPKGGQHTPRDIFVRYSDDEGITWSTPVNLSRTAGLWSSRTDWDGDGVVEEYYGDSGKPTVFNNGNNVVITWTDKYVPEDSWAFGQVGQSSIQGVVSYPDLATYPNTRDVPYAALYAAVSHDGGATWQYGGSNPPLQLTYGRRDVGPTSFIKGAGPRWTIVWQEDPDGLQTGGADGPGDGASGAKVSKGTDAWFTFTTDIVNDTIGLRDNRVPLSNHSAYDTTGTNGFPVVGNAGSIENHGASRPNLALVNDGGTFKAVVSYEETKGTNQLLVGKTIQLHIFPFNLPPTAGAVNSVSGDAGTGLSDFLENSRRVRFVTQSPNGTNPAIAIFWRQGIGDEGAPADIMLRTSPVLDEAAVAAAPLLNLSSTTPSATSANLMDSTQLDPIESARAHRAFIRGPFLAVGYSYTPNDPVARFTDLENYNFWIRRTMDGGQTWLDPQNISNVTNTQINVKEPRLVGTQKSGTQDDQAFIVAWGTETNVYEGIGTIEPLDVQITRTTDRGATFEPVTNVAASLDGEFESQLRVNDDISRVYAAWMRRGSTGTDGMYALGGNPVRVDAPAEVAQGSSAPLVLHAPGYAGDMYFAGVSLGISPGVDTPFGRWAMNNDVILQNSLGVSSSVLTGFSGVIGLNGEAFAGINVPSNAILGIRDFYVSLIVVPMSGPVALGAPTHVHIR